MRMKKNEAFCQLPAPCRVAKTILYAVCLDIIQGHSLILNLCSGFISRRWAVRGNRNSSSSRETTTVVCHIQSISCKLMTWLHKRPCHKWSLTLFTGILCYQQGINITNGYWPCSAEYFVTNTVSVSSPSYFRPCLIASDWNIWCYCTQSIIVMSQNSSVTV